MTAVARALQLREECRDNEGKKRESDRERGREKGEVRDRERKSKREREGERDREVRDSRPQMLSPAKKEMSVVLWRSSCPQLLLYGSQTSLNILYGVFGV